MATYVKGRETAVVLPALNVFGYVAPRYAVSCRAAQACIACAASLMQRSALRVRG